MLICKTQGNRSVRSERAGVIAGPVRFGVEGSEIHHMQESDPQLLVSTDWLGAHIDAPDVRILDATYRLPGQGGDPKEYFLRAHIRGARFFDIDDVSDSASLLPHMLPPIEKFVSRVRALGVGDGHRVIVYDQDGLFSAPRVWWTFRVFGFRDIAVLDGGLRKWIAEGRPVDDLMPPVRDRHLTARKDASLVKDVTQVAAALKLGDAQVVDARSPGRFRGEEPEARPGLRAGHMPGAVNLHYSTLLKPDGTMKPVDELRLLFEGAGVDLTRPVVTSCGSGVTAAILALALERIGHRKWSVYDGSWAEWGSYPDLAVVTG